MLRTAPPATTRDLPGLGEPATQVRAHRLGRRSSRYATRSVKVAQRSPRGAALLPLQTVGDWLSGCQRSGCADWMALGRRAWLLARHHHRAAVASWLLRLLLLAGEGCRGRPQEPAASRLCPGAAVPGRRRPAWARAWSGCAAPW